MIGRDPPRRGTEVAVGAKLVPRAVDAPKGLHGQILCNAWIAHNAHGPGVDVALKLTYQRLERIDLAMREPLEHIHSFSIVYYGTRIRRLQVFRCPPQHSTLLLGSLLHTWTIA